MAQKNQIKLSSRDARCLWMRAQGLNIRAPFGSGPEATARAVEQLGYVQIDTINVIERCHHHILFSRIPDYSRAHLHAAQTREKSIFEYWTHALSYVPTKDFRFFVNAMKEQESNPSPWYGKLTGKDLRKIVSRIKRDGPLSIRDITDDVLVEKDHEWASRKPSKKVLQFGFYAGRLVVGERLGMLKKYELTERHFGWEKRPKAATSKETLNYKLDRALRSQSIVSLDSICHLDAASKAGIHELIESRIKSKELVAVQVEGAPKDHWARPTDLDANNGAPEIDPSLVHILSPFDPLVIQRKRLKEFFGYAHRFEAYVPPAKRVLGYFALPVLVGDRVVAALDLKTDRQNRKLLIQKWIWFEKRPASSLKMALERELERFEDFQLRFA